MSRLSKSRWLWRTTDILVSSILFLLVTERELERLFIRADCWARYWASCISQSQESDVEIISNCSIHTSRCSRTAHQQALPPRELFIRRYSIRSVTEIARREQESFVDGGGKRNATFAEMKSLTLSTDTILMADFFAHSSRFSQFRGIGGQNSWSSWLWMRQLCTVFRRRNGRCLVVALEEPVRVRQFCADHLFDLD